MITLHEAERQLDALWAAYPADNDLTDDEIDAWADRMGPLQRRIEQAVPTTSNEAAVILRNLARNVDGHGLHYLADQIGAVARFLDESDTTDHRDAA